MDSSDMQYMLSLLSFAVEYLPPGFRFHPTEEELVVDYLAGGSQDFVVIPEIDICDFDPEMLPIQFNEKSMVRSNDPEWWFLCKQEQGQKAKRSTGNGYWKITGNPSEVKSGRTNQIIGFKRFLTFYRKNLQGSNDFKSNWVMHEYYLPDGNRSSYVICHVKLKPPFNLPHTEPRIHVNNFNGNDSTTQVTGSWSISSPSVSPRSERIDLMDILEESETEHCNFPEDQIQMRMKSLLSSSETPTEGYILQAGMDSSFSSEDQDSQFNFGEESEKQDFWNDFRGTDDQIPNQFCGDKLVLQSSPGMVLEVQNSRRKAANIRENMQTQTMKPVMPVSRVRVIDEVNSVVTNRSGKLCPKFIHYDNSALPRNRKIKTESAASSCLVHKKSKNSGQEARLNCKTESASCDNRECESTPPISYLFNFLAGILLLILFLGQVF